MCHELFNRTFGILQNQVLLLKLFKIELTLNSLKVERQKTIPISYKGIMLDAGYRLDLVVEDQESFRLGG